jgi:hypothetical protein
LNYNARLPFSEWGIITQWARRSISAEEEYSIPPFNNLLLSWGVIIFFILV